MSVLPPEKITFAGKSNRQPMPPGPIGLRGVALLRRVKAAEGPYRCERNADAIAWRCIEHGMLRLDRHDDEVLHLTEKGRDYLSSMMRAVL